MFLFGRCEQYSVCSYEFYGRPDSQAHPEPQNGSKDETVYQIADYMYHLMVLMADRDISWEDVTRELIRRR